MRDVLLLLGLPASGKSEVRRYLADLDSRRRMADLGLGDLVNLDDFPYVHLMRRVSQELRRRHTHPVFYATDADPFLEPGDWLTLTALLDEDYAGLARPPARTERPAAHLLDRFDRARAAAGLPAPFAALPPPIRDGLEGALTEEAIALAEARAEARPSSREGCTVIIELSRGGGESMRPPFPPPWGYAHSLTALSPAILERAAILYVWVSPEESRRRNRERARPGEEGSVLHHGTPERVLRHDYASDDIAWLLDHADRSGHITLIAGEHRHQIPTARFDNRADHTSFLRTDPDTWPPGRVASLHRRLRAAFGSLARR